MFPILFHFFMLALFACGAITNAVFAVEHFNNGEVLAAGVFAVISVVLMAVPWYEISLMRD